MSDLWGCWGPDAVLRMLWQTAIDAVTGDDFRGEDGELNEEAYLRYQRNAIAQARAELGV
jgi:hypothetical protein